LLVLVVALIAGVAFEMRAAATNAGQCANTAGSGVPKHVLGAAKALVPALSMGKHKGQAGRIGVVGGSYEYTGAPFYSALAALRAGADLAFVFCHESAALPIKSYSPELIVYPRLRIGQDELAKLSSVLIGPGLGRETDAMDAVERVVSETRRANTSVVLDGDALWWLNSNEDLLRGHPHAIITPNGAEFDRLYRAAFGEDAPKLDDDFTADAVTGKTLAVHEKHAKPVAALASWLGGVTVVRKGRVDIISNGDVAVACGAFGSPRRCGGQGDVLAGVTALFAGWARQADEPDLVAAAYGACVLARRAAALAFAEHGRAMTTPDLFKDHLGHAFAELFEDQGGRM